MSATIEGLARITEMLDELADVSEVKKKVGKACALVEGVAKELAPKESGALKRSIESRVEENGSAIVGEVFTPLEYAPYVEFGTGLYAENGGRTDVPWAYEDEKTGELIFTSGQHPQPYLRPALMANKDEILRILREG